jgi:hypothetical protein
MEGLILDGLVDERVYVTTICTCRQYLISQGCLLLCTPQSEYSINITIS